MAFSGGGFAQFAPTSTTVAAFGPKSDPCYVMALAPRWVAHSAERITTHNAA
jgi:hypothetical protein